MGSSFAHLFSNRVRVCVCVYLIGGLLLCGALEPCPSDTNLHRIVDIALKMQNFKCATCWYYLNVQASFILPIKMLTLIIIGKIRKYFYCIGIFIVPLECCYYFHVCCYL